MNRFARSLKGAVIGALIGCCVLVYTPHRFKGYLGEPEFIASYVGYIIPYTIIVFLVALFKPNGDGDKNLNKKQYTFMIIPFVLACLVVGKIAVDFPNGEGLFHPTHAENIATARSECLKNLSTDKVDTQETKETYCSCWAERFMIVAEKGNFQGSSLAKEAELAGAACRPQ